MADYTPPLPQCEGPKLRPFGIKRSHVTFHRLLSDGHSEGHAHVFEASIDSVSYAIKVFKFHDILDVRSCLLSSENARVSDEILDAHTDPFNNECRAYGRLEEMNLNGKIAVRCYGYIYIPAQTELQLERRFQVMDWNRRIEEYDQPPSERRMLRAVVKELVLEDAPMTGKVADKMLRDLKRIRRCGVFPIEIELRNYKSGLLLDMSCAMTEPYYLFGIRHESQVRMLKSQDLHMWQAMVDENGFAARLRAVRDIDYCAKLRPRKQKLQSRRRNVKKLKG